MLISAGKTSVFGTKCFSSLAFKIFLIKLKFENSRREKDASVISSIRKSRVTIVHDNLLERELATSAQRWHLKLLCIIDVETV